MTFPTNLDPALVLSKDDPTATHQPLGSAELIRRERKISIYFRPPEVTAPELTLIKQLWVQGVPIVNIMRKLQGQRIRRGRPPLIYLDVYTILYTMLIGKEIQQRLAHPQELTINDFAMFFRFWKNYGSFNDCLHGLLERPTEACKKYAERVFRSIGDRHRREGRVSTGKEETEKVNPLDHLIKLGLRKIVDDRPALVVFLDDVPINLRDQLKALPDALRYEATVESSDDIFDRMQQVRDKHTEKMMNRDEDLVILDPDGTLTEAGKAQKEQQKEKKEERKRLQFGQLKPEQFPQDPSPAHSFSDGKPLSDTCAEADEDLETLLGEAGSDSGNLTLDNLADDDPV